MVGAPSHDEIGLFYQWGSIVGHAESERYVFSLENYEAQGLNLITSDLNDNQDAARAFYGQVAKMPTSEQALELLNYTTIQRDNLKFIFTSIVNGEKLIINTGGYYNGITKHGNGQLRGWLRDVTNNAINVFQDTTQHNVGSFTRYYGVNIMAVHS